uniref:Uncharacterized protein n=1 Tax=Chromera velia CCMP2878 TaxID=1169474 RepID=A0A0G4I9C4_9ALVE|eukprot:Cvel_12110.t1-p1 / transcript=Cvel_12110.t1 / gene=Cvel_12110 / organism=Chromera_velia_CCMP2878 / gene_product=hypothetical protein / transcript_product=hypothetical protein / location=Cvel_scaffold780:22577-31143(+) / protein_length=1074 / sequence_SO=supercontig / SO=protein_coding / is_pseudo=false
MDSRRLSRSQSTSSAGGDLLFSRKTIIPRNIINNVTFNLLAHDGAFVENTCGSEPDNRDWRLKEKGIKLYDGIVQSRLLGAFGDAKVAHLRCMQKSRHQRYLDDTNRSEVFVMPDGRCLTSSTAAISGTASRTRSPTATAPSTRPQTRGGMTPRGGDSRPTLIREPPPSAGGSGVSAGVYIDTHTAVFRDFDHAAEEWERPRSVPVWPLPGADLRKSRSRIGSNAGLSRGATGTVDRPQTSPSPCRWCRSDQLNALRAAMEAEQRRLAALPSEDIPRDSSQASRGVTLLDHSSGPSSVHALSLSEKHARVYISEGSSRMPLNRLLSAPRSAPPSTFMTSLKDESSDYSGSSGSPRRREGDGEEDFLSDQMSMQKREGDVLSDQVSLERKEDEMSRERSNTVEEEPQMAEQNKEGESQSPKDSSGEKEKGRRSRKATRVRTETERSAVFPESRIDVDKISEGLSQSQRTGTETVRTKGEEAMEEDEEEEKEEGEEEEEEEEPLVLVDRPFTRERAVLEAALEEADFLAQMLAKQMAREIAEEAQARVKKEKKEERKDEKERQKLVKEAAAALRVLSDDFDPDTLLFPEKKKKPEEEGEEGEEGEKEEEGKVEEDEVKDGEVGEKKDEEESKEAKEADEQKDGEEKEEDDGEKDGEDDAEKQEAEGEGEGEKEKDAEEKDFSEIYPGILDLQLDLPSRSGAGDGSGRSGQGTVLSRSGGVRTSMSPPGTTSASASRPSTGGTSGGTRSTDTIKRAAAVSRSILDFAMRNVAQGDATYAEVYRNMKGPLLVGTVGAPWLGGARDENEVSERLVGRLLDLVIPPESDTDSEWERELRRRLESMDPNEDGRALRWKELVRRGLWEERREEEFDYFVDVGRPTTPTREEHRAPLTLARSSNALAQPSDVRIAEKRLEKIMHEQKPKRNRTNPFEEVENERDSRALLMDAFPFTRLNCRHAARQTQEGGTGGLSENEEADWKFEEVPRPCLFDGDTVVRDWAGALKGKSHLEDSGSPKRKFKYQRSVTLMRSPTTRTYMSDDSDEIPEPPPPETPKTPPSPLAMEMAASLFGAYHQKPQCL